MNLVYAIRKRMKNMASFSVTGEVVRRIPRARRNGVRLPPYGHPHAAPHNSPAFRVDRRQAARGVCEQTNPALLNYIIAKVIWGSVKTYFIAVYFRQLVSDKGLTQSLVTGLYVQAQSSSGLVCVAHTPNPSWIELVNSRDCMHKSLMKVEN